MANYAFMFPGQGSQKVGMGKALAEAYPQAKAVFDEADEALGLSLSKLCFEGPEDELALTANTQPAILTCSIATLAALRARGGPRPMVAMGHSLGEFSALVCSGALRFADAVRLVRLRGEAMQEAVPAGVGAMAAIMGIDADDLESLCEEVAGDEVVSPANENGGGQIVVAGHAAAVKRLMSVVKEKGGRAIPLRVSAPFHCALMQGAAERLGAALDEIEVHPMDIPVIANVDAHANDQPARLKDLLVSQVTHRVRWESSVKTAEAMGVDAALELGEGKVLAGLVKRITKEIAVTSVGNPEQLEAL